MRKLKKSLKKLKSELASWWRSSLPRLPISYLHHLKHRAWLDGKRRREVAKEAWQETLETRRARLGERKRRKGTLEKEGVHA